METIKKFIFGAVILSATVLNACQKDFLEPEVFTETVPANLFNSLKGVESVLFGAYAKSAEMQGSNVAALHLAVEETLADNLYSIDASSTLVRDYNIDGGKIDATLWNLPYESIRNCNILLENIDKANITDDAKTLIRSEATFIRAIGYFRLYERFGPVPLRTSTQQDVKQAKATEQDMTSFIESELKASVAGLPEPKKEAAYGRAHKAAAIGYLMKVYLATKQWDKAADAAKQIIDMKKFSLFPDYFRLFFVANEGNSEMIWVRPAKADVDREAALTIQAFAYPPNFKTEPISGLEFVGASFGGSNIMLYDSFYNSFSPADKRRSLVISQYINTSNQLVDLSKTANSRRPFKFWPDQDIVGSAFGNDLPEIRYADVLLTRAEALNEQNGLNQESIDLINQVRKRAGVTELKLSEFTSKEALRDHLLNERGWEFYLEGQRRHDLIRHGKLIERAKARGLNAKDHQVRYPIPTFALDANPLLKQNTGY